MTRKPAKKQTKLDRTTSPEKAAKLGNTAGVQDAFCTECKKWYDTNNQAQVDLHAH